MAADYPFVTVLWLYDSQVRDLAQNAPDMWAWRAAVLDFALPPESDVSLPQRGIAPEQSDLHERRQRLVDIETYLNGEQERYASDAVLFREMAHIYTSLGDIYQAEDAAKKARDISREHDDKKGGALALGLLADVFVIRGELDEALRIRREEELPVYERLGDVREIAITKGQIADILQSRGELDEALRIRREEELPVYERLGEARSIAAALNSLFDLYWELEEFQKAYEAISRAFTIVVQLGIPDGISVVGFRLGRVLMMEKQPAEAKDILMQSRDAAAKLGQVDRVKAIDALLAEQDRAASDT